MAFAKQHSVFQTNDLWIALDPIENFPVDLFVWKHRGDQSGHHIKLEIAVSATTLAGRGNLTDN